MSDKTLINLDKILVKLAFQVEKTCYAKEHLNQRINLYTAKITEKKNKIAWLEENMHNSNEAIADLQKQNESSKKNCKVWKSTYALLSKHGEYLKNEIEALEESTDNERKIYQDYITQYKEILQEHRKKYTETALAQEYYKKKEEVEEIQHRILKHCEKYNWKEDACLDIPEAVPFKSINDWTVHIASVKKKTQEMLQLAEAAAQESIELQKEAEELEMKIDYLKKMFEETKEAQNNSEKIEGKNQKSLEKPEEFKERMFEEHEHSSLPNEKHQPYKALHVPCIPQKLVQSVQSFRFSKQRPETGRQEKEKPMEISVATSSSSSLAENLSQMVIDTAGINNPQTNQVPSVVSIQNQMKFRLSNLPKRLTSKQQFESGNAVVVSQEAKRDEKEADGLRESSYIPQDAHMAFKPNEDNPGITEESAEPFSFKPNEDNPDIAKESAEPFSFKPNEDNPDITEESAEPFSFKPNEDISDITEESAEPFGFKPNEDISDIAEESEEPFLRAPKTPDLMGKKTQFFKTPPFDFIQNLNCEEGTSKSPAPFSLMNFSQKSPGFNLFHSSLFGGQNSSDEAEENYSVGNLNALSPHKDIGSFFGKSKSEDAFAFSLPSESTSHAFGDGKDDYSFPFAFGQDQRSSQSPSMKGFHSSLQNTKPFTLF